MNDMIIYEQPLNEVIRVALRLEQLFKQIDHQLKDTSLLGTREIMAYIMDILHILDRPDLKAKLAKELSHHHSNLIRYGNNPGVDVEKCRNLTNQLEALSQNLIDSSGKIGQNLRDLELLSNLRLHLATPGGGCSFDIPMYHYWLKQPVEARQTNIQTWLAEFAPIKSAVELILILVRKNAKVKDIVAIHGFHQELLDPQSQLRMLRIGLAQDLPAYPEISIGRHFLSIRFISPSEHYKPSQYSDNLPFWLGYCST